METDSEFILNNVVSVSIINLGIKIGILTRSIGSSALSSTSFAPHYPTSSFSTMPPSLTPNISRIRSH